MSAVSYSTASPPNLRTCGAISLDGAQRAAASTTAAAAAFASLLPLACTSVGVVSNGDLIEPVLVSLSVAKAAEEARGATRISVVLAVAGDSGASTSRGGWVG